MGSESKTDIWMPLYIGDYLADTSHLDAERHGCYLLWMMHYWRKGPLPNVIESLVMIGHLNRPDAATTVKDLLAEFFTLECDGRWHQKRIDVEIEKSVGIRAKRAKSGSSGAIAKWGTSPEKGKANRAERLAKARLIASHLPEEWQALLSVCGPKCLKCGAEAELVKDHILPVYKGGSDGIENIQPMCRKCNAAKGPESVDYRPKDWRECMAKLLANACYSPSPLSLNTNTTSSPSDDLRPSPKERVASKSQNSFSLPEWVPPGPWKDWLEVRKKKRAVNTPHALELAVKELAKLRSTGEDPEAVINQSILRGYTGLFSAHTNGNGLKTAQPKPVILSRPGGH